MVNTLTVNKERNQHCLRRLSCVVDQAVPWIHINTAYVVERRRKQAEQLGGSNRARDAAVAARKTGGWVDDHHAVNGVGNRRGQAQGQAPPKGLPQQQHLGRAVATRHGLLEQCGCVAGEGLPVAAVVEGYVQRAVV